MAVFDMMWITYPHFRRGMYVGGYLWATFGVQAGVTAVIIRESSYSTAYKYDQILPLVATALGHHRAASTNRQRQNLRRCASQSFADMDAAVRARSAE